MEPENFVDPVELIRLLDERSVRYLLVGRQAVVQYGAPLQSFDFDFFLSPDEEDLRKLHGIASDLDLEVETPAGDGLPAFIRLHADNVSFDFFRGCSYRNREGAELEFEAMWERRVIMGDENFRLHVPSLDDLIETKKFRDPDSPEGKKDAEDIRYLLAVKEHFES